VIDVREIARQDLEAIGAGIVSRDAAQHRRRLERHERGGGFVELIGWLDGRAAGWVALGWHDDVGIDEMIEARGYALVYDLHVEEACRRRGVARALMLALEERAERLGAPGVLLDTGTGNDFAPARALYRSLGYEEIGGVYIGGWSDPDHAGVHVVDQLRQWVKRF
jgi:ribosomal protein S18 acetylase RimI-like enzyme